MFAANRSADFQVDAPVQRLDALALPLLGIHGIAIPPQPNPVAFRQRLLSPLQERQVFTNIFVVDTPSDSPGTHTGNGPPPPRRLGEPGDWAVSSRCRPGSNPVH